MKEVRKEDGRRALESVIKKAFFILLIVFIVCSIGYVRKKFESRRIIDGNVLKRNISIEDFPREPTNQKCAWEQDVPDFVIDDINYLKANQGTVTSIQYIFKEMIIEILTDEYDFDPIQLRIEIDGNKEIMNDFSIYHDDKNIIVYGYQSTSFYRYIIDGLKAKESCVAKGKNLPLYKTDVQIYNQPNCDDYSIAFNDDGTISLYSRGKLVSEKYDIGIGEIQVLSDGMVINGYNLYHVYINSDYQLKIEFLGMIDEINNWYDDVIHLEDDCIYLRTFKLDGEDYVVYPNDWNTYMACYKKYPIPEETDYSWNLVRVADLYKSAKVCYDYSSSFHAFRWITEITVDVNGKEGKFYYDIDGYDSEAIRLSDEDKTPIKVESEEEYWEAVEEIRSRYEKYYTHPE